MSSFLGVFTGAAFPSMGNGDGFDWEPSGVTYGIDFTTDRIFDGETITSDYTAVLGGPNFVPAEITAEGMAFEANFPNAIGPLLTKFQEIDYTYVIYFRTGQLSYQFLSRFRDDLDDPYLEISIQDDDADASDEDGDFNTLGVPLAFSDNVMAISFNVNGLLGSLNGNTAALNTPQITTEPGSVSIGTAGGGGQIFQGFVRAIIFYAATNAAGVEAYAANTAPLNTVAPVISGTAQVGQQLSVSTGTWTGAPTSYRYQWYRDNFNTASAVGGATSSAFTPTEAEVGVTMKCVVYGVNADGIGGVAVSDDETVRTNKPEVTVSPVVSGTPSVGQELSTTNGTWDNSPTSYAYQWYNDNGAILGATASTYTVQVGDTGLTVGAGVTATNAFGSSAETYSNFLGPVT